MTLSDRCVGVFGFAAAQGFDEVGLVALTVVALEALQHLVLPVVTLSIAYWGILGKVTRAAMIDETNIPQIRRERGGDLKRN